ncbi:MULTISPECIES: AraC family transcriptional regulator [unclassified Pseudomonas]|uniref:helix-turn-helix transcriptional regulator n=1 Tax=unclassified Pseudomonas TaxID=196821 RepID=UPI002447E43A|nr:MULTISPECIES: AraC family transcriptional regulator [unclassified Pseudomonas]MDH0301020.1 AraC family transcriptional regulator [Pseudomonas sp. GD04091]MDH1983448.1 AraC family transcriptional regulator [Pseudomonas sp. GD03689]
MFSASSRKQIILRSADMRSEDFAVQFSRLFGSLYADLTPLPGDIVIGGVYGRQDGMSFRRMRYRGDFSITFPAPQDEITFVLPSAGKVIFAHRGETVGFAQVGLAIDKAEIRSVRFAEDHAQCGISIRRGLFNERLALLLGRALHESIRFEPVVDLQVAAFRGIRALLELATGDSFEPLLDTAALMPARLQEMLVDALLEAWPHNHSEALRRPAPMIAPRHVRLAMDYLREHPEQPVSGTQLTALANVSLRALQEGFRRFAGTSIASFQRQVRLERAYQDLARGDVGGVGEVASRYGFSNPGRFAQYFQQAYGVRPTEVRRGLRGIVPAQKA